MTPRLPIETASLTRDYRGGGGGGFYLKPLTEDESARIERAERIARGTSARADDSDQQARLDRLRELQGFERVGYIYPHEVAELEALQRDELNERLHDDGIDGRAALDVLQRKRYPPGPIDPRRAVIDLLAKPYPPGPLTPARAALELAWKRTPRQGYPR
jgi:hypothetical protein